MYLIIFGGRFEIYTYKMLWVHHTVWSFNELAAKHIRFERVEGFRALAN